MKDAQKPRFEQFFISGVGWAVPTIFFCHSRAGGNPVSAIPLVRSAANALPNSFIRDIEKLAVSHNLSHPASTANILPAFA
jgi:hypothetical protein